jgi:3-phosphoshikimate 1-carboxyvinyltransferase
MIEIFPIDFLEGIIASSPSKSYSHRAFAISILATTPSYIINPLVVGDVSVTIKFCKAFGAEIKLYSLKDNEDGLDLDLDSKDIIFKIIPISKFKAPEGKIDGGNSGTSIRIMCSLAGLLEGTTTISGSFFEKKRPLEPLLSALSQLNIDCQEIEGNLGIKISPTNPISSIVEIPGDISSQFITALLFLAPHLKKINNSDGDHTLINIVSPIKSYPYLKITEQVLTDFGIKFSVNIEENLLGRYIIPSGQTYKGRKYVVPGDFSSAAFILVAAALNPFPNEVIITNIDMNSPQGDKKIVEILEKIGAKISIDGKNSSITVTGGEFLNGFKYDCSQTPDLFPILCVLGLFANHDTTLFNATHLRIKESDRIAVMVRELRKMGAVIQEHDDGVFIQGPQQLVGTHINHSHDHRIAMALSIAALFARSTSTMNHKEIVSDSYPGFFEDLQKIGASIKEIEK